MISMKIKSPYCRPNPLKAYQVLLKSCALSHQMNNFLTWIGCTDLISSSLAQSVSFHPAESKYLA